MSNLAACYQVSGQYTKAESMFERVLETRERIMPRDHPDTLTCLNNLAGIYLDQGRYLDAAPLLERALKVSGNVLDEEHPLVLALLNKLSDLRAAMGESAQAFELRSRQNDAETRLLLRSLGSASDEVADVAFHRSCPLAGTA